MLRGGGVVYDFHSFMQQISGQVSMLHKLSLVESVNFLFQVNGTLKITAKEVRDEEKERKAMVKTHLDLVLSSISTVVVIICLILLSCLRCSVSLILRSVTNMPINLKFQHPPGTLLAFECRPWPGEGNLNLAWDVVGHLNGKCQVLLT